MKRYQAVGKDIREFVNSWPKEWEMPCDGGVDPYDDNGDWALKETEVYDLREFDGIVKDGEYDNLVSFMYEFKRWKKRRDNTTFVVTVANDKAQEFVAKLVQMDIKDWRMW